MTKKPLVTVITYISDRGALVRIDPEHVPVAFDESASFSAKIELGSEKSCLSVHNFNFVFKKEAPSAGGQIVPAMAVGVIEGLTKGAPSFDSFKIKEISETA